MPAAFTAALLALSVILVLGVGVRASVTRTREGKILAFVALLVLPSISMWAAFSEHMERATSTQFCLSCHVMEGYGKSLKVDDRSYVPARHYQNNLISRDHACYTCH